MKKNLKEIIREFLVHSASIYSSEFINAIRGFIIAKYLGPSLYGFWGILRGYFDCSFYLGLGTTQAMTREVPALAAKDDKVNRLKIQQNSLSFKILLAVILSTILLIFTFTPYISQFKMELRLAALVFILTSVHYFIPSKFKSEKKTFANSKYLFSYTALNAIIGLSLLYWYGIMGLLAGMGLAIALLLVYLIKRGHLLLSFQIDWNIILKLMRIGLPIMILSAAFFAILNIDKILVYFFLGSTNTGYYNLASFLSSMINYIPNALSTVLFPRLIFKYSQTKKRIDIIDYFLKPTIIIAIILPVFLALVFINIEILIQYFLSQYKSSVPVLRILIPGLFFSALWRIPTDVLIAFNKQKKMMYIILVILLSSAIFDLVIIKLGYGLIGVAYTTLFTLLIATTINSAYALYIFGYDIKKILMSIGKIYMIYFYFLFVLWFSMLPQFPGALLTTLIQSVLFLLFYLPMVFYMMKKTAFLQNSALNSGSEKSDSN